MLFRSEFFADKPESIIPLPDSAGSAVIRRVRSADANSNWFAARQSIEVGPWHASANGQLGYVLSDGWSVPEEWGVWGVGPSHRLQFKTATQVDGPLTLDCDVHAFTPAGVSDRPVSIVVNGEPSGIWHFVPEANRAVRSLTIPGNARINTIEFRHNLAVVPSDVDPKDPGARPLGMAVHRIRVRAGA